MCFEACTFGTRFFLELRVWWVVGVACAEERKGGLTFAHRLVVGWVSRVSLCRKFVCGSLILESCFLWVLIILYLFV